MKTLYLLRHAKSSWRDEALDDFDRPLTKRGRAAAEAIGRLMTAEGLAPGQILCSASQRTRETLERLQRQFAAAVPVRYEKQLYLADTTALLRRLKRLNDTLASVMLIGHNPGIEGLALLLLDDANRRHGRMGAKFSTGALAVLSIDVDHWSALQPGCARLESFVRGKDLVGS
jgi:phosphohistidine phosphatase